MKKIFLLFSLALIVFQSCKKDEIGGTATQKLSGEWFVTADLLNADGSLAEKDVYGIGHFLIGTYNVSENTADKIWVDDYTNFWSFKGKVSADVNAATFSGKDVENEYPNADDEHAPFTITNGKILEGAATTPSGMPADSITLDVKFSDDPDQDLYRITGYRYTGLVGDEDH